MIRIDADDRRTSWFNPERRADWPRDAEPADIRTEDEPEVATAFLSPPPAPWPRIFPGL
ncbi:MAG: hypothetical protein AB7O88_05175 [Reyranellaceae bacterium]